MSIRRVFVYIQVTSPSAPSIQTHANPKFYQAKNFLQNYSISIRRVPIYIKWRAITPQISLRSLLRGTPIRFANRSTRQRILFYSAKTLRRIIGIERTAKQRGRTDDRTEGAFALSRLRICPFFRRRFFSGLHASLSGGKTSFAAFA